MRAIDADALQEKVEHDYHHKKINRYDRDLLLHYLDVEMAPTIKPERKLGKWITQEFGSWAECSECHELYDIPIANSNFCPNCGADMRGVQDD